MLMYVCVMNIEMFWKPEKASDSLELELQKVMNHPVWVLETKLGASGGAARAFNCQINFKASEVKF